ncbi:LysR substrate-binding domain-containing protein [Litoribacillus peritrichatus]|uniref:Transcriptional regulator GcvA n=1 Tax=Litoribacillus peritrichatus TaxID=718191 RepID=A0ABP7N2I4_9GAMM
MKYKQSPPIQYIPVFEAAARHLSFKKAADELCVSAPAVGQQIKAFEDWLGKPLFQRHTRKLSLTPEGKHYQATAMAIMKVHYQGFAEYERRFEKSALKVSAPLFVAQELIMPHYLEFSDYLPNTELRLEARMSFVDFDTDAVDAAIRFGDGNWPELDCRPLSNAFVAPVCSHNYAKSHPLNNPEELHQHRLIYAEPAMSGWGSYFWKGEETKPFDIITCDSYLAALKAASNDLGIALGIFPTANRWINEQRLHLPFPMQIKINRGFWLVSPKSEKPRPELDVLYLWVKKLFDEIPKLDSDTKILDLKELS